MILVFGSINVDLVARVAHIARPGETVLAPDYRRFFGGKGANQAVAAARMAGPPAVAFCGAVGADGFGEECLANLKAEGVDVSHVARVASAGTGCAFISVDTGGENAITVAAGANGHVRADLLDDAFLQRIDVAVMQMEVPWRENAALAARLAGGAARIVLNFAPARADIPAQALRAFLSDIDHLVVNEHEAETLAAALGLDIAAPARAIAESLALPVVVTLGREGVALMEPGAPDWSRPAMPVDVVDTTGAGDTFVGVFAAGLAEGLGAREAIVRAGHAASLSCTRPGAQGGMPRRDELPA